MNNNNQNHHLGFIHKFIPSNKKSNNQNFILFHGTGGNEEDLIPLARELSSEYTILGLRGKVLENEVYAKFFQRLVEGIFDIEDFKFKTKELVEFIKNASSV